MRSEARTLAPAKINLHLEIGSRRPDGFHELVSIFQAVNLFDTLLVRVAGGAGEMRLAGEFGFPPSQNIVTRAVEAFRAETGIADGLEVSVDKRIPMGAGLGGGSSDAAATLRCLRALLCPRLPMERMEALAASLGSDVPFFLGAAARAGRGKGRADHPPGRADRFCRCSGGPRHGHQDGGSVRRAGCGAAAARARSRGRGGRGGPIRGAAPGGMEIRKLL